MMVRFLKRLIVIGTIVFILLVISIYTSFCLGNTGISIEQISLTTSDGIQLNAEVYKPTTSSDRLPAIVVCHGIMATHTMMQSYSLEFAKQGFLVIAIDMRGHGGSGGSIDLGFLFGLMGQSSSLFSFFIPRNYSSSTIFRSYSTISSLATKELRSDVEAAVTYLTGRSDVQPEKIALLGHSMGGLAVIAEAATDPRIRATVGVAPAISSGSNITINLTTPQNLLLAVGMRDSVIPEKEVRNVYDKATSGSGLVGQLYGSFLDGSARELVVSPSSDHVGEMFDRYIIEEAVMWVENSLAIGKSQPLTISFMPDAILPLSIASSLLSIFPVVLVADKFTTMMAKKESFQKPKSTKMRARKLLLIYLVGWGCSVLSFLTQRLFHWIPLFMGDMIIVSFMIAPIVLFLVAFIYNKRSGRLNWDSAKLNKAAFQSFVVGILCFFVVFIGLNMAVSWNFVNLLPTPRRLLWVTVIFAVLLPFNFLDEVWIRNLQNRLTLRPYLKIGIVLAISLSIKLLAMTFLFYLFGAFVFLVAALFVVPSFVSAWLFERTGKIYGGAVFNSLFIAWVIATILPFISSPTH